MWRTICNAYDSKQMSAYRRSLLQTGLAASGQHRRQHERAEPVRGGQAEQPLQLRLAAGQLPLEGKHLLLDPLGMAKHRGALVGDHEPLARTLEQRVPDGGFQRP